jgi:GH43 family beta-xylosidase
MKLFEYKEGVYPSQPDPFILKGDDGKYYIYSTSPTGVQGFVADTLDSEYKGLGVVYSREDRKEYWAPAVIFTEGKYYMYVSNMDVGETDVHMQTLQVAVSDTPSGPFEYLNDIIPPFSIDAHVVKSGNDLYIFYSSNDYEAERAGTYILVDKMLSPTECEGKPVAVLSATLDEEIFMRDRFKKGQHWHTLEGACYFREGNDHYLIYSGNCYESEFYYLGYAHAYSESDDLREMKFEKQPSENTYSPLIAKNGFEAGTGHCSVIKDNGQYYCVYHGRDLIPDERIKGDNRTARICKLHLSGNLLTAERYEEKL